MGTPAFHIPASPRPRSRLRTAAGEGGGQGRPSQPWKAKARPIRGLQAVGWRAFRVHGQAAGPRPASPPARSGTARQGSTGAAARNSVTGLENSRPGVENPTPNKPGVERTLQGQEADRRAARVRLRAAQGTVPAPCGYVADELAGVPTTKPPRAGRSARIRGAAACPMRSINPSLPLGPAIGLLAMSSRCGPGAPPPPPPPTPHPTPPPH